MAKLLEHSDGDFGLTRAGWHGAQLQVGTEKINSLIKQLSEAAGIEALEFSHDNNTEYRAGQNADVLGTWLTNFVEACGGAESFVNNLLATASKPKTKKQEIKNG